MRKNGKLTNSNVEPVLIVGGELFSGGGLDGVNPWGKFNLTDTLEVGGVCGDEFSRWDVLDGATGGSSLHVSS